MSDELNRYVADALARGAGDEPEEIDDPVANDWQRFSESLGDDDLRRAASDPDWSQRAFEEWQAAQDANPTSGVDVIAWARRNEADIQDAGWDDADHFISVATTREGWAHIAAQQGWSDDARPRTGQMRGPTQMESLAAGINAALAREARIRGDAPTDAEGARVVRRR